MLKFVCFLPIGRSWANSLHVLTSCLQRFSLPAFALRNIHRESAMGCGVYVGVVLRVLGVPRSLLEGSTGEMSPVAHRLAS